MTWNLLRVRTHSLSSMFLFELYVILILPSQSMTSHNNNSLVVVYFLMGRPLVA